MPEKKKIRHKLRSLSLTVKANILIIFITLVISLSLIGICESAYRSAAIDPYQERLARLELDTEDLSRYLDHFLPFLGTDELKKAKMTSGNNYSHLYEWMSAKPSMTSKDPSGPKTENLYTDWYRLNANLYRFLEYADFDEVCVEIIKDDVTYRIALCNQDTETYSSDNDFGLEEPYIATEGWNFEKPQFLKFQDEVYLIRCLNFGLNNGEGRVWLTINMTEESAQHLSFLRNSILYVLVVTLITSLLMMYLMHRYITRPIRKIAKAAEIFVADENGQYSHDKISHVKVNSGDELEYLNDEIRSMQIRIVENTEHLTELAAEKERINSELTMASQIQNGVLPRISSLFQDRHEFRLHASMNAAKEVGGDFYDFFFIDEDHLALTIADVSGKGIPAALFMMISKAILKNNALIGIDPSQILALTNETICSNNRMEMFVTVWLGILEISTGKIICSNAGHEYPIVYKKSADAFDMIHDPHGFIIGGLEEAFYKNYEIQLEPGDKIFLYTDGVMETMSPKRELFGKDRTIDTLNLYRDKSPKELLDAILHTLREFMGDGEQFDDITMLCLEYLGTDKSGKE